MSGVNKAILIGNIGSDPDCKEIKTGGIVANVSIATSDKWKDADGNQQEKTEWHRVVFFRRMAEIAQQYLKKGDKIYVEGKIQTRKWQDNEGNDRYTTEIIGNSMQMLGSRGDQNGKEYGQTALLKSTQEKPEGQKKIEKAFETQQDDMNDDIPF